MIHYRFTIIDQDAKKIGKVQYVVPDDVFNVSQVGSALYHLSKIRIQDKDGVYKKCGVVFETLSQHLLEDSDQLVANKEFENDYPEINFKTK